MLMAAPAWAQRDIPEEYRGTSRAVARGILDGNLIETNFRNHGELARHDDLPWGIWPRGVGGRHIDGVGIVVSGLVAGERVKWGLADSDTTLNPVIINYRDAGRRVGPNANVWGWLPLEGFHNPNRIDPVTGQRSPTPALSDDPTSWPAFWPDRLDNPDDPGWRNDDVDSDPNTAAWNGIFGKGVRNADLEAFYVMDDLSDYEYALDPVSGNPYSPYGVFYPDPADSTMGGLGLQVQVRILQWANILAEDTAFLLYRISNVGQTFHDQLYFSQIMDYGLGQEEGDENAAFDPQQDVAYGWDQDGVCQRTTGGTYDCGYTGFAFLESPARSEDGLDNDEDGITDEGRFSGPGRLIEGQEAIRDYVTATYNTANFTDFHGVNGQTFDEVLTSRPAFQKGRWWTGDENLDWVGFDDVDEDGVHDEGELLNNDLGRDGLGPNDLGYPGPDTGEGDGVPTAGEPNFDQVDVDESDQIGLTGFDLDTRPFYESGDNLRNDTWMFERILEAQFPLGTKPAEERVDIEPFLLFSSGTVSLDPQTANPERSVDFFSTAWVFGDDEQDFFKNRRTVQSIYNADYNFAQPPLPPTLTATPGDGQVVLTWDDLSLQSFDRFCQVFDFEGFKLYRGTDPLLSDARTITDANGTPTFYEPIAQWDLDNGIVGNVQVLEGDALFDLGSDTGLQFYYVDDDVKNGFTYYYALVAYDRGCTSDITATNMPDIGPQENVFNFSTDLAGNLRGTSRNAVQVMPRSQAAGYQAAGAATDLSRVSSGIGTGSMDVLVYDESVIDPADVYKVTFFAEQDEENGGSFYATTGYRLENVTDEEVLIDSTGFGATSATSANVGFFVEFDNDEVVQVDPERTGYVDREDDGPEALSLDPRTLPTYETNWVAEVQEQTGDEWQPAPYDYELRWVDPADSLYQPPRYGLGVYLREEIPVFAVNTTTGQAADLLIVDNNENGAFDVADALIINEPVAGSRDRHFRYRIEFELPQGVESDAPDAGDVLRVAVQRPFAEGDFFQFTVRGASFSADRARDELDRIKVVPNPYIAAAKWERASPQITGRGERKVYFTHLPPECTVRIFNLRGELVRELHRESVASDGQMAWDLRTEENQDVAYGMYIYHVEAPGIGEKVGKLALIK